MKNKYIIVALVVLLALIGLFFYFKDEKVYTFKEYSPSGKLISTNEYVIRNGNSIQHGKFVNYNEKGVKIAEGNFVNNEPNGKSIYYFDNGKIESVHYRENSKITEESTFNNSNGLIRKYIMYNDVGEPYFIIDFDEKGVREYNGSTVKEIYQYQFTHKKQYNIKTEQVLKVGDVLKYHYLLANTPNANRSFKIENVGLDNSKIKRTITQKVPTSIIVEEILIKKGINTVRAIAQYKFNDKVTPAINDTISFNVNVK
jgi:hypothetical protein